MSSIKERITATIESTETRMGRGFDLTIQVLIVISLSAYALETLPNLTTQEIQFLNSLKSSALAYSPSVPAKSLGSHISPWLYL